MGGTFSDPVNLMAGSQELGKLTAMLGTQKIEIESETYIGLSISGDQGLIESISQKLL
jgi:hypothetical protein